MRKNKQTVLFGVSEFMDGKQQRNYISMGYIQESDGEHTIRLHPRNRLSKRLLLKMRSMKGRSKKEGTKLLQKKGGYNV